MKNLIIIFIALFMLASCLDGGQFNQTSRLIVTFEADADTFGSDSLYFNSGEYNDGFLLDNLFWGHKVEQNIFKGGFILSNLAYPTSGVSESLSNNEYRANHKSQKMANAYAVFCETDNMPECHFNFFFPASPLLKGSLSLMAMMVNNTVAVADAVNATFEDGDVLSLKVTGYLAGKKTNEAEMKLAEFTSTKDSIVHNWTMLDLSKLGMVDSVRLAITPPPGKAIPKAVCIDDLFAYISISSE